ncbi:hypothetical protein [Faecalibacterium hattorii]
MNEHDVLKKNRNFYIGVGGTVLEETSLRQPVYAALLCYAVFVVESI